VVFDVTPEDADVIVKDVNDNLVPPEEQGVYALNSGFYTYTVSKEGFITKEDTFIIGEEPITITVVLEEEI